MTFSTPRSIGPSAATLELWHIPVVSEDYPWSSAAAHLAGQDDTLVKVRPLLDLVPDWRGHLSGQWDEQALRQLRRHEATGRPIGEERFLRRIERKVGRAFRPGKPG